MRVLVAAGLVSLLLLPTVLAATGPYEGTVRQGETDRHRYSNSTKGTHCPAVIKWYTVVVDYTPTTDSLTVSANGYSATGTNGQAAIAFEAAACTSFTIEVTGTQVANVASYTVTVTSGSGAGA